MKDPRKATVATGYDRIAGRYLEWSRGIHDDPRDSIVAHFSRGLPKDARVLELGCGAGIPSTQRLARRFRVVGVDFSSVQIDLARQRVPAAEFIEADFSDLAFPDASFDGVIALYAISHVPREEHRELFARIHRWLAPGGLFAATLGASDSPDWTGQWLGTEMFFSSYGADQNRRLLETTGFELVFDHIRTTHEPGGDVQFLWVIGRKVAGAGAGDGRQSGR